MGGKKKAIYRDVRFFHWAIQLWHFVVICRICNTVSWLKDVEIDKNEVWWFQRRIVMATCCCSTLPRVATLPSRLHASSSHDVTAPSPPTRPTAVGTVPSRRHSVLTTGKDVGTFKDCKSVCFTTSSRLSCSCSLHCHIVGFLIRYVPWVKTLATSIFMVLLAKIGQL